MREFRTLSPESATKLRSALRMRGKVSLYRGRRATLQLAAPFGDHAESLSDQISQNVGERVRWKLLFGLVMEWTKAIVLCNCAMR